MTSSIEIDPALRYALTLLHSTEKNSAEKIRLALDDIINSRHGANKMLVNTLSKKHLAEESNAPGTGYQRSKSSDSGSSSTASMEIVAVSSDADQSIIIDVPDDDLDETDDEAVIEADHFKVIKKNYKKNIKKLSINLIFQELEDLMCVICRRMDVSVRNRLVECSECHSLYHQECHKPPISEAEANDQENVWNCALCKSLAVPLPKRVTASSSPARSSPYSVSDSRSEQKSKSNKNYESSSSSSSSGSRKSKTKSSSKPSKSSKSSSKTVPIVSVTPEKKCSSPNPSAKDKDKASSVMPNITIISADKRLQNMKKKAAKLNETKRKHK